MTATVYEAPGANKAKKVVNYTLVAEIVDVNAEDPESLVTRETITIESVSKISAEDRARRFFRKNKVPMNHVVREVMSETKATWLGFVGEVPADLLQPAPKAKKAPRKPRTPKTTPEEVFNRTVGMLNYLYERWQDEKAYEDWAEYEAAAKSKVESAPGVKMVSFTDRPFQLKFKIGKDETVYTIGRNNHARFVLK